MSTFSLLSKLQEKMAAAITSVGNIEHEVYPCPLSMCVYVYTCTLTLSLSPWDSRTHIKYMYVEYYTHISGIGRKKFQVHLETVGNFNINVAQTCLGYLCVPGIPAFCRLLSTDPVGLAILRCILLYLCLLATVASPWSTQQPPRPSRLRVSLMVI